MRRRHRWHLILLLVSVALLFAPPIVTAQEDSTCAQPLGTIRMSQDFQSLDNFCGVTEDPCQLGGGQAIFMLQLDGVQDVDLTCTSTAGTLCVLNAACSQEIARDEGSVRIVDPGSTSLRLVLSDENALNANQDQICTEGATVMCTGNWGTNAEPPRPAAEIFSDGFESGCHGNWRKGAGVEPCLTAFGAIGAGERVALPADGYESEEDGPHRLDLLVWGDVQIEARLWARGESGWVESGNATATSAAASVRLDRSPGRYRWELDAVGGSGLFWAAIQQPGWAGSLVDNSVSVDMNQAYRSVWSLETRHFAGSRERAFLIDLEHPEAEARYIARFQLRPGAGFSTAKDNSWTLLQAQQEEGVGVREVFRLEVEGLKKPKRVRLRAWAGSREAKSIKLKRGQWKQVVVDYRSAGGVGDEGWICLSKRGRCSKGRRRSITTTLVVDRILLGRVTGANASAEGSFYLDDFESRREE